MNKYETKKYTFIALVLGFALSTTHLTYPMFDWLDAMRDKLSEPVMGKVTKDQNKSIPKSNISNRQHTVKKNQEAEKTESATSTPVVLDIAEMLTQAYCTDGIKTPINRIGVDAAIKTGYQWFGRKISSAQALPQLAKGVLVSTVMFSIHNLAAYFLYPNWLKERWWTKGIADGLCSSMVTGLANRLFGTSLEQD